MKSKQEKLIQKIEEAKLGGGKARKNLPQEKELIFY